MTAEIVNLRSEPTAAQRKRVRIWAEGIIAEPSARNGHSLCQDLAHFMLQIELTSWMICGRSPRKAPTAMADGDEHERMLLKLHRGAEALMCKAMNEYPATQALGKKPRRRRKP